MIQKYIALTIGPIGRTLDKAKSTKALWGASYLFSYLMKNVVLYLYNENRSFVFPVVDVLGKVFDPQSGAGLFPDRLIFEAEKNDMAILSKAINDALDKLCTDDVCNAINHQIKFMKWRKVLPNNFQQKTANKEDLKAYLIQYLTLYALEDDLEPNTNIVKEFNTPLSTLELQSSILPEEPIDYLSFLLENINETHLPKDAYGNSNRFPSIIEIATQGLDLLVKTGVYQEIVKKNLEKAKEGFVKSLQSENNVNYISEEDNLIVELKNYFKDDFKRQHKYIAIVKADGDNMGKTFEELYKIDKNAAKRANELLFEFNIKAIDLISKNGGKSIFVGGDDLLFFAPIKYGESNIFDLIKLICDKFDEQFKTLKTEYPVISVPTLSFGVSISYYKFPMFEALEIADYELHKAKPQTKPKLKNNVAFRFQKHSGQSFGEILSKINPIAEKEDGTKEINKSIFDVFIEVLKEPFHAENAFLSSIQYVLLQNEDLLVVAIEQNRLENFFDNFFNESIHTKNKFFIDKIRVFIETVFRLTINSEKARLVVYSALRMIQFFNQPDNQEENDL